MVFGRRTFVKVIGELAVSPRETADYLNSQEILRIAALEQGVVAAQKRLDPNVYDAKTVGQARQEVGRFGTDIRHIKQAAWHRLNPTVIQRSVEEYAAWREWLIEGAVDFKGQPMPPEVKERCSHWEQVFTHLELCSNRGEYVLFGFRHGKAGLLAHWVEDGVEPHSLAEVKAILAKRDLLYREMRALSSIYRNTAFYAALAVGIGVISFGISHAGRLDGVAHLVTLVFLSIPLVILIQGTLEWCCKLAARVFGLQLIRKFKATYPKAFSIAAANKLRI